MYSRGERHCANTLGVTLEGSDRDRKIFFALVFAWVGAFIGLIEEGQCRVRFIAERGEVKPMNYSVGVEEAKVVLLEKQPYWTDDLSQHPTERGRAVAAPPFYMA